MAQSIFKFYKQHIYNPIRHISLPSIALILIGITCFILIREFTWQGKSGKDYEQIISGDGKGYYMYLPNIFLNKTIKNQIPDNRYIYKLPEGTVNKYYIGTAVLMLPFFWIRLFDGIFSRRGARWIFFIIS